MSLCYFLRLSSGVRTACCADFALLPFVARSRY